MIEEQQQSELYRDFDKEEFCVVLTQLLESMGVEKNLPSPEKIYDQIFKKNGRVIGKDLIELVQSLQGNNQVEEQELEEQIRFYQIKIRDFMKQGSKSISLKEFQDHFQKSNPHCGVLTEQIYPKVCHLEFISIPKLQALMVRISKMKQMGKSFKLPSEIDSLQKTKYYFDEDVPIQKIFDQLNDYIQTNIFDIMARQNLSKIVSSLQKGFEKLSQKYADEVQVEKKIQTYRAELEEQLVSLELQLMKKQNELKRVEEKCSKQSDELQNHLNKERQYLNVISSLSIQNDDLSSEKEKVVLRAVELEESCQTLRSNYEELSKQLDVVVSKSVEDQKREESENKNRLFTQRTAREQLEQAHEKINRLRTENTTLQQKKFDIEAEYEAKVNSLQQKIKQLEEYQQPGHISRKFQGPSEVYQSRLLARRSIFESQVSRASLFKNTQSLTEDQAQMLALKLKQEEENKEITTSKMRESAISSVLQVAAQSSRKEAFKKKKNAIAETISVIFPSDSEQQLNQYDEVGILTLNKSLSELTSILGSSDQKDENSQKGSKKVKGLFSATAYIQNESGTQFLIYLIVSTDRFTILDTKKRFQYSIKFSQLQKIIFCHYNLTWIALKTKPKMKNEKGQSLIDMVISLTNRSQLLEYLYKHCAQSLQENGTSVKFEKQDYIWLRISEKDTQVSSYVNCYNLYRQSINNSHNIFQAKVKQGSSFFGTDVYLIVNNMGMLCFEKKSYNGLIEQKPNLLFCLPLVEKMSVIDLSNQFKIKLTYENDDKSFRIKLNSYAITKKLKKLIDEQRAYNFQWKINLTYEYSQLVDMTKSRRR